MSEQTLTARERTSGPGGLGSIYDEPEPIPAGVRVECGPHNEYFPLAGRSVGEVRRLLGPRLDIAPNGQAVLNGQDVDDDAVLQQGQLLTFSHRVGEKGFACAMPIGRSAALTPLHRAEVQRCIRGPQPSPGRSGLKAALRPAMLRVG